MTESYTYGQDAFQPLQQHRIAGQTFNPSQDHVLYYVDVQIKLWGYFSIPSLSIKYADGDHQPFGPLLSQDQRLTNLPTVFLGQHRLRFAMIPVLLNANTEYILSMTSFPPLPDSPCEWAYDSTSALYLRGHRILSNDSGTSWTHYWDQDHIFAEFGDPPAPPPPPDAPVSNFALYGLTVFPYELGALIYLTTTVPCHLSCYHTKEPPRQFMLSRITRGLSVPWHVYYSFSSFNIVEQTEPGDTLFHAFYLTNWPICQTRWFTFRGLVNNIQSPSVGPIFTYHHKGTPLALYEYYNTGDDDLETISGTFTYRHAQSFTPLVSHQIAIVKVKLSRAGSPGIATLGIKNTDEDGLPTGFDLTSGTFDANLITTDELGEWVPVTLNTPIGLLAGTRYAILIRYEGYNPLTDKIYWRWQRAGATYPRGSLLWVFEETWQQNPDAAWMFEEWGFPL